MSGEYIIPVKNKLFYTSGSYQNPRISQVIEIREKDGYKLAEVKKLVQKAEQKGACYEKWVKAIKRITGQECVVQHNKSDFSSYGELKRRASISRGDTSKYWNGKPRGYYFEDSDGDGKKLYDLTPERHNTVSESKEMLDSVLKANLKVEKTALIR